MPLPAHRPALRQIVSEAARALAQLDAGRLEELALSCQALNRDLNRDLSGELKRDLSRDSNRDAHSDLPINQEDRLQLAAEARAARRDMEIFARVLEATRANVHVIERLRELRSGRLEYTVGPTADFDARWPGLKGMQAGSRHGND